MTKESIAHLNTQTLIGYTEKRGNAWHYRAEEQGLESNHYDGAIPVDDVLRRLFSWHAVEGELTATYINDDGVTSVDAPKHKAIMNPHTGVVFGVFSQQYKIHQYDEWLLNNVASLLDGSLLAIGSAGVLKEGGQAWVQIENSETVTAAEGVQFRPFLTAATSLDGSLATTYMQGVQVVVCDNTLSAALGQSIEKFKVRHSSQSLSKIDDVRAAIGLIEQTTESFEEQIKVLTADVVSRDQWREFVAKFTYPGPNPSSRSKTIAQNKAEDLNRLWNYDERVAPWQGSAYGVVAAVNTWEHHSKVVRNATRAERNMGRMVTGDFDKVDLTTLRVLESVR